MIIIIYNPSYKIEYENNLIHPTFQDLDNIGIQYPTILMSYYVSQILNIINYLTLILLLLNFLVESNYQGKNNITILIYKKDHKIFLLKLQIIQFLQIALKTINDMLQYILMADIKLKLGDLFFTNSNQLKLKQHHNNYQIYYIYFQAWSFNYSQNQK
ncbi:unnamed protein product (macronuclear) [Paramecium tetraurelia]|uniref:Transmembrane protein n=1 Tax=Paramecium tetraurelia TaxID=5888 RepID=A0CBA0_PARTE|nr:uncharacterized protein GSPATT00036850001 [Paramecium tetraurelia]CAK68067.1 unnamed protein product [Paramecium tetraurelia]|eukprot:XP_001435464.1 hypothetical protein (macronuclear) [Paramecium tetraurelia strain d4-2]